MQATGIADFLPGAEIDDALFDPCGYSANGLIDVSECYFEFYIRLNLCYLFGNGYTKCCGLLRNYADC